MTDPMAQGILGERLENQIRHQGLHCVGIDIDFNLQPVGKTHLLNLEIEIDEIKLFLQLNLLAA